MPEPGFEPGRPRAEDVKSPASASCATPARGEATPGGRVSASEGGGAGGAVDRREARRLHGAGPALRQDRPAVEDLGVADVAHVRAGREDGATSGHDVARRAVPGGG